MDPFVLLQLADSALPTGAFAHSAGLEAAVQLGRAAGGDGVEAFLRGALWNAGTQALPFVRAAHRTPGGLAPIDLRCDAATPGHVPNRASRAQGRALLRAAAAAFGGAAAALEEEVRGKGLPGHLAPAHGALLAALGAAEEDAARLHLFQLARGIASAGVRLGACGPLEAQAILARAARTCADVLAACRDARPEDAATSGPLLELLQGQQDRLYSRLFQS